MAFGIWQSKRPLAGIKLDQSFRRQVSHNGKVNYNHDACSKNSLIHLSSGILIPPHFYPMLR